MWGFVLDEVGAEPRLTDLPAPVAAAPYTAAEVCAAGVNPVDLAMAADPSLPVPRVVGNEAVVVAGGRRAYAERTVAPHGSMAEVAVVDPALLVPLPDDVPDDAAIAVGIAGIAPWVALESVARLEPGETVIVLGATGAVGRMAVQVARVLGAGRVVAAGRNPERLAALADLGADVTVTLADPDADTAALTAATGGGADVVLDLVYGAPLVSALHATRQGARVVSAGAASGADAIPLPFSLLRGRTLLSHSNRLTDAAPKGAAYRRLLEHLRAGDLDVDTTVLPLAEAARAWARQRTSPGTKLVLVP